ncbi:hypothetical protein GJAV_G00193060 [Gymnothorax javanicus]|nr:hypothetical protein GJAV_G00193060 [Gymnothorax javanicus]
MDVRTPPCNNTSNSPCEEEPSSYALIVIPALLVLSTTLLIALIIRSVCFKKREPTGTAVFHSNTNGAGNTVCSTGSGSVRISSGSRVQSVTADTLGSWEIPEDCALKELDFLHTGRYGPVCKSQLTRGQITSTVVVKSLRVSINQAEVKEFVNWARFHAVVSKHENLVQMLFCQTRCQPMYLVLEAVSPGNLLHFLWNLRSEEPGTLSQQFSERSVYLVAKQVADGLEYLHSEHRLAHGDVAARSVLIGAGLSVRVAGLGMAFEAWETGRVAKRRAAEVPLKWQAPERIKRLPMTTKSDVWSFGILLYELITLGAPPYPELEPLDIFPQIQNSYRMKKPENCGGPLYDLMTYCWMWNSNDRPAFSTIIRLLKSYSALADTKTLTSQESIDIFEYSKMAGVFP